MQSICGKCNKNCIARADEGYRLILVDHISVSSSSLPMSSTYKLLSWIFTVIVEYKNLQFGQHYQFKKLTIKY